MPRRPARAPSPAGLLLIALLSLALCAHGVEAQLWRWPGRWWPRLRQGPALSSAITADVVTSSQGALPAKAAPPAAIIGSALAPAPAPAVNASSTAAANASAPVPEANATSAAAAVAPGPAVSAGSSAAAGDASAAESNTPTAEGNALAAGSTASAAPAVAAASPAAAAEPLAQHEQEEAPGSPAPAPAESQGAPTPREEIKVLPTSGHGSSAAAAQALHKAAAAAPAPVAGSRSQPGPRVYTALKIDASFDGLEASPKQMARFKSDVVAWLKSAAATSPGYVHSAGVDDVMRGSVVALAFVEFTSSAPQTEADGAIERLRSKATHLYASSALAAQWGPLLSHLVAPSMEELVAAMAAANVAAPKSEARRAWHGSGRTAVAVCVSLAGAALLAGIAFVVSRTLHSASARQHDADISAKLDYVSELGEPDSLDDPGTPDGGCHGSVAMSGASSTPRSTPRSAPSRAPSSAPSSDPSGTPSSAPSSDPSSDFSGQATHGNVWQRMGLKLFRGCAAPETGDQEAPGAQDTEVTATQPIQTTAIARMLAAMRRSSKARETGPPEQAAPTSSAVPGDTAGLAVGSGLSHISLASMQAMLSSSGLEGSPGHLLPHLRVLRGMGTTLETEPTSFFSVYSASYSEADGGGDSISANGSRASGMIEAEGESTQLLPAALAAPQPPSVLLRGHPLASLQSGSVSTAYVSEADSAFLPLPEEEEEGEEEQEEERQQQQQRQQQQLQQQQDREEQAQQQGQRLQQQLRLLQTQAQQQPKPQLASMPAPAALPQRRSSQGGGCRSGAGAHTTGGGAGLGSRAPSGHGLAPFFRIASAGASVSEAGGSAYGDAATSMAASVYVSEAGLSQRRSSSGRRSTGDGSSAAGTPLAGPGATQAPPGTPSSDAAAAIACALPEAAPAVHTPTASTFAAELVNRMATFVGAAGAQQGGNVQ